MDFSELQQSWQQQAAPLPAAASPTGAASLLAETERLRRFGRRRNWLGTALLLLAVGSFTVSQLLDDHPRTALQYAGLALLDGTLLGYVALMWWGTALRQAARPDLSSRAYVQAALRAFRFRRGPLLWLAVPYAVGFGTGLLLWNLPRLGLHGASDWWKPALTLTVLLGVALLGRRTGLRKYEQQFGPAERALARWQQELLVQG